MAHQALVPITFRLQVSHRTQELSSEFLLTELGIRQDASRRTSFDLTATAGLVGLRERAHAVGGKIHAGPHHQGGYRLTATLPRTNGNDRYTINVIDHAGGCSTTSQAAASIAGPWGTSR